MTALEQRQDFALNQYAKGLLKPFVTIQVAADGMSPTT